MAAGLVTAARDGVSVAVRLAPRARRERVEGVAPGADGAPRLRVAVAAPPVEGRANAALLRLLARAWGIPPSALTIAAGAAARDKRVHVAGDPEALRRRLDDWAAALPGGGT